MTANLKVGLGLFNQRGAIEPAPVTRTFTDEDLTVTRLDEYADAFTIELVNEAGGAVVGVKVSDSAVSPPRTGVYTLSANFAPAGEYFGLAQRDFNASRGESHETQFYPVELVVNWTAPAQAVAAFTFAGVTVSTTEGKAKITANLQDFANGGSYNAREMEYFGNVGGLRVMFSRDSRTPPAQALSFFPMVLIVTMTACAVRQEITGGVRHMSELGMIITPAGYTCMDLTVNESIPGALSASSSNSEVLDLNFADADGGLHDLANSFGAEFSTEMRVISGLVSDGLTQGFGFIQSRGQNTDASLGGGPRKEHDCRVR